ncbi:Uncharacterised protein [Vibrio cholerae]|nr:Uncharacterised protein [Vibrio cholerae]
MDFGILNRVEKTVDFGPRNAEDITHTNSFKLLGDKLCSAAQVNVGLHK